MDAINLLNQQFALNAEKAVKNSKRSSSKIERK
jgi:hypothetical protein